ncbi:cobalamin-dependent protein [Mycobacterium tuberculosis]|uniref:cobalamin-dependent protein n=1 Tax=Mycobacterium tuberculosis TaxID=1773 RepID=UPI003F742F67
MMSIKAYAKTQGIAVTSVNGLVAGHGSVQETWLAMQSAAALSGTPRLVGFSCIDTFPEVLWLAQRARQAWDGVRIVIGNAMATLNYERILRQHDCFDYVVVGDGEVAFTKLALALANDAAVDDVPGLARRSEQGQILRTPSSLVDLDELPRPARDELPTVLADGFAASVFSTRGCSYRCTFCGTGAMSAMLGKDSYRAKSVDAVVDEIDYLVSDYDVNFLSITDDLFISKHPGSQRPQELRDLARRPYDLTLLTTPDVPWDADDGRCVPGARGTFFARCEQALRAAGRSFVVITGGWEERLSVSLRAVEELVRARR